MAYLDKCIERGVNYDTTVREIRCLFRSSDCLNIKNMALAILTEFEEYVPGNVQYDHLEKGIRDAIQREKAVINQELGSYLKRIRRNGLQHLERQGSAASAATSTIDTNEKQAAHQSLVDFGIEYGEFAGSIPQPTKKPKNGYAAKNSQDRFLIAYATAWKMTDVEKRLAEIREAASGVEKSDDCTALESKIEGLKKGMKQKQSGLKREYFWTFIHPPSEWRILSTFSTYAGLQEAANVVKRAQKELDEFDKDGEDGGLYRELQKATDEIRRARDELVAAAPSLDKAYISHVEKPARIDMKNYEALKQAFLKKFQRGYVALEDTLKLYDTAVKDGRRKIDNLTHNAAAKLQEKITYDTSFTPENKKRYENMLEQARNLCEKRERAGLGPLGDLMQLGSALARNVEEIERHLDREERRHKAEEAEYIAKERARTAEEARKKAEVEKGIAKEQAREATESAQQEREARLKAEEEAKKAAELRKSPILDIPETPLAPRFLRTRKDNTVPLA